MLLITGYNNIDDKYWIIIIPRVSVDESTAGSRLNSDESQGTILIIITIIIVAQTRSQLWWRHSKFENSKYHLILLDLKSTFDESARSWVAALEIHTNQSSFYEQSLIFFFNYYWQCMPQVVVAHWFCLICGFLSPVVRVGKSEEYGAKTERESFRYKHRINRKCKQNEKVKVMKKKNSGISPLLGQR